MADLPGEAGGEPPARLLELEEAFDRLLPRPRLAAPPSAPLLDAARRWSQEVWREARRRGPLAIAPADARRALEGLERGVLVCGAHRSGTSLMRDLLDGHSALSVLPSEGTPVPGTGLDPLGQEWLRRLANPINQAPYWLQGRSTDSASASIAFARALLGWWDVLGEHHGGRTPPLNAVAASWAWTRGSGRIPQAIQRFVEKTPERERELPGLLATRARLRVVQMVRHPFAVFDSRERLERRAGGRVAPRRYLWHLARSYAAASRAPAASRRHLVIRYEDLLEQPGPVTDRLARFLEIEPSPALLEPTVAGRPASPNSAGSSPSTSGQIVARLGQVPELDPMRRRLVAAWTALPARRLGYDVPAVSAARGLWLRLFAGHRPLPKPERD
jgi:hypothetical protein